MSAHPTQRGDQLPPIRAMVGSALDQPTTQCQRFGTGQMDRSPARYNVAQYTGFQQFPSQGAMGPLQHALPTSFGTQRLPILLSRPCISQVPEHPMLYPESSLHSSGCSSPASTDTDTDYDIGPTPSSRRRSVLATEPPSRSRNKTARSMTRQVSSQPHRSSTRDICVECGVVPPCEHREEKRKTRKEAASREEQSRVLQFLEDLTAGHGLWDGVGSKDQSSGNGNKAGIVHNKIDVLKATLHASIVYLNRGWEAAVDGGYEEKWRAEQRAILARGIDKSQPVDLLAGLTVEHEVPKEYCSRDKASNSKACALHGQADWRKCRSELNIKRLNKARRAIKERAAQRAATSASGQRGSKRSVRSPQSNL